MNVLLLSVFNRFYRFCVDFNFRYLVLVKFVCDFVLCNCFFSVLSVFFCFMSVFLVCCVFFNVFFFIECDCSYSFAVISTSFFVCMF